MDVQVLHATLGDSQSNYLINFHWIQVVILM